MLRDACLTFLILAWPWSGAEAGRSAPSLELLTGMPFNLNSSLSIRQDGEARLDFDAAYRSEPFRAPIYWAVRVNLERGPCGSHGNPKGGPIGSRAGIDRGSAGWSLELLHQKLILDNPPPEVQAFAISHGLNFITLQRSWRVLGIRARAGLSAMRAWTAEASKPSDPASTRRHGAGAACSKAAMSRARFFLVCRAPTCSTSGSRESAAGISGISVPWCTTRNRARSTPRSSCTCVAVKAETQMIRSARSAACRACVANRARNSALEYSDVSTKRSWKVHTVRRAGRAGSRWFKPWNRSARNTCRLSKSGRTEAFAGRGSNRPCLIRCAR